MRLDLFLKKTAILKRRTIAQLLIKNGRVFVNGKNPKVAYNVKIGDVIRIISKDGDIRNYKVLGIPAKQIGKGQWKDYIEEI